MDIYEPIILSERTINNFLPSRLIIKELAGQLYFCKSTKQNVDSYTGSGVVWKKRIKKYGKENIKTLWVSDWYYDPHEIQKVALQFSCENRIVESDKWANIKPENGLDGGSLRGHLSGNANPSKRPEVAKSISNSSKGKPKSSSHKKILSEVKKGKPFSGKRHIVTKGSTWTQQNPSEKIICPHCDKSIDPGNYRRWHGDNCKLLKTK